MSTEADQNITDDGNLVLAESDASAVIAQALADYKTNTISPTNPSGTTLAPADPRRLHLQALLLLVSQMRAMIDYAGKQSLLGYVGDEFIDALAQLWGAARIPAEPAVCVVQFNFGSSGAHTVAAGVRVTDGTNIFAVVADASNTGTFVLANVQCSVNGAAQNGIAPGQISTLVDTSLVAGCTSVTNTTETISGRDVEELEAFRARLRDVPENLSTCGPRTAYEQQALEASDNVADAAALGPDDGNQMAGYPPPPGNVYVYIIEGDQDDTGTVIDVIPQPSDGLIEAVEAALSADDVRPLTDLVTVQAPIFVAFDAIATYYIPKSRANQASQIQTAVGKAWAAWLLWQQASIGRDINPDYGTSLMVAAGAKRVAFVSPSFEILQNDQSALASYIELIYGGIEQD